MKILLPVLVFVISLVTISFSNRQLKKKMAGANEGFALVELFTSEGCSSCPPADALVEEMQKKYEDKNVLVLGYHVDYWDRLGWKDPFSSAAYTARQQYYARVFDLETMYTPQVVVNGEKEFVGSNRLKLQAAIKEEIKNSSSVEIKLDAHVSSQGKIDVEYITTGNLSPEDQLVLLLVQKMATNKIGRGENSGRTLRHINIVRSLITVEPKGQRQSTFFDLPADLGMEDSFVAAFIQSKKNGHISAIQSADIH